MKNTIFDFESYKDFAKFWIKQQPNRGRGVLSKIGKKLNISSVSVSHIFNGPRDLSSDQALELSEFMGLNELESDYFMLLVNYERAASAKLKNNISIKIKKIRSQAQHLKTRIPQDLELDEKAKALFYSNWYFSAVRLVSSINGLNTIEAVSTHLNLPKELVREIFEFLVTYGLCKFQNGKYVMGPKRTHLESESILVQRHHTNWRLKAIENMNNFSSENLFYTGPMVLSNDTIFEIRKMLVNLIEDVVKKVEPSTSEKLACLNIDWFKI